MVKEAIKTKRTRGQQKSNKSPCHSPLPSLLVDDEVITLSETACGVCGKKYSPLSAETSDLIEIEVSAHIRRIKRQKCVKNCTCIPGPKIIIAPPALKVIPQSPYMSGKVA